MAAELFETLRSYDGVPALLDAHLARLGADADAELRQRVIDLVAEQDDDVVIRIVGREIELRPLPPETPDAVEVTTAEVPGYSYPQKSTDRAQHEQLQGMAGGFDVLICDRGEVIEGAITNVFVFNGDELATSPLGRCLPGVTRAALLAFAPSLGINVRECTLNLDQLSGADEVLLTNSLRGVKRVAAIDGIGVGGRAPEVQHRLQSALLRHYREEQR